MSRPLKPRHEKVLSGTLRPHRDRAASAPPPPLDAPPPPLDAPPPPLDAPPPPPVWLPNAYSRAEWRRIARVLHANDLLAPENVNLLGHLCALHGLVAKKHPRGATVLSVYLAVIKALHGGRDLSWLDLPLLPDAPADA